MNKTNEMRIDFLSVPENEGFARVVVSAFILPFNPIVEEMEDVKMAISEAVTNAIIHGYRNERGMVRVSATLYDTRVLEVEVMDSGVGIANVTKAREPMYTSCPEMERSGMGFTVMQSFMDHLEVVSEKGRGTTIRMRKQFTSLT